MTTTATKLEPVMPSPNYEFEFHDLANEYPLIEGEDFDELEESIRKHGILEPIVLHEGRILDGRNRYRAAKAAGHKFAARDFKDLAPGLDPEEFVTARNDARRHLSSKQKRELIAKKINRWPDLSDKEIGRKACCDRKTVASVREEMKKAVEVLIEGYLKLAPIQREQFSRGISTG
jgi:hypothetical protein